MFIKNVSRDTITDIKILDNLIFVSSFDKKIHIFNKNKKLNTINHFHPISKMITQNKEIIFADIKGNIVFNKENILETQCGGIQGLLPFDFEKIIAGGWNKKIQIIKKDEILKTIELENKIYFLEKKENILMAGCDMGIYLFLDLRMPEKIIYKKMKNPISSIAMDKCAAIGSIFGKIKIDFDIFKKEAQESYLFNAHVKDKNNIRTTYPVTALIFKNSLFSGGSDGKIIEFDYMKRRMTKTIFNSDIPVSIIENFNHKSIIAGFSDNFERGYFDDDIVPEVRIFDL